MGQRRRSRGPCDGGPRRHAGRSWTNLILRDTTTSRGAHLVEGIVLVPVPDAALPRVPHRTLHLLPGEIVHGGLARREMNARSGLAFYVPLFWVIFSETAVDARLAEIQLGADTEPPSFSARPPGGGGCLLARRVVERHDGRGEEVHQEEGANLHRDPSARRAFPRHLPKKSADRPFAKRHRPLTSLPSPHSLHSRIDRFDRAPSCSRTMRLRFWCTTSWRARCTPRTGSRSSPSGATPRSASR